MFKIFVDFAMTNRSVLTNFRRYRNFSKKDYVYHRFVKFDNYRNLLVTNLGLDMNAAIRVLRYQESIFNIPEQHLVKQCQLCQKLNVDPGTLFKNIQLLYWSSNTLRHRVLLLREIGVSHMHAAMVSNFQMTIMMRVGLFKAYTGVPESVNVVDNLLKCLHDPPPSAPPLEDLTEELTVNDLHKRVLRWYIQWKLNVPEDDERALNHIVNYMRHRSFKLMARLFDTLHDDIGLTIEQIKKHGCLSAGSAEDLRRIIDEIKTFGGLDFRNLIKRHPALHAMEYENVVEVIRLLKEYDFTNKAMRRSPEILLTDSHVIASRLKVFEESPEIRVLKHSGNALLLIDKYSTTEVRLEYLRYLNIKFMTVNNLVGYVRYFKRFLRTGVDRTKGREIGYSLEKSLKLDANEIRRQIAKHPYWRHADLVSIHDTLEFLLERFTTEDLHDSLQLLLYPREKIAETLENLPELTEEPSKRNSCTPKQILAICLYEIEREHHFSGDGIWKYDAAPPRRREYLRKPIEPELSDCSDSENAECEETEESSEPEETEKSSKKTNNARRRKLVFRKGVNKNVNR